MVVSPNGCAAQQLCRPTAVPPNECPTYGCPGWCLDASPAICYNSKLGRCIDRKSSLAEFLPIS
eukprot:360527-Chlamydomonas_euryale.AAC.6